MTPTSASELAASGMFLPAQTQGTVPCCLCGRAISPNPASMCGRCLDSNARITDDLPRHAALVHCPECLSWLQPPRTWLRADPESRELLALCLRRVRARARSLRIVDAAFVWTEPHSKRIRLALRVQGEALGGAVLEKGHEVEFVQHDRLCDKCARAQASPDQWAAAVQLRQHVPHRRTFLFLEQAILRHGAAARALRVKEADRGIDFFFGQRSHAVKFVEFIGGVAPVRSRSDKQLVSQDSKSNLYNYKHTFSVEICPVCREDLMCLPPRVATSLGNLGPLVVCAKVSSSILLLDPFTLRHAFLDAAQYWRAPFRSLLTSRQLVEYVVLHVKDKSPEVKVAGSTYCLARIEVARASDMGVNDIQFDIQTHLGHLFKEGDIALGYDLYAANTNDSEVDKYKGLILPDAILMKKTYEDKRRGKSRPWKLKRLNMEIDNTGRADEERRNSEYEEFLKDMEENPESRFNISLYRNKDYQPSEITSTAGDDDSVRLDKLLAELDLSEDDDEEAEEEDDDMEE